MMGWAALLAASLMGHGAHVAAPLPWEHPAAPQSPDPLALVMAQPVAQRAATAANLAHDHSATGMMVLWLFAHDPKLEVRMAALTSALVRCPTEAPGACMAMMAHFNEDKDAPGTWLAREALLTDRQTPVVQTLTQSKLELLARLQATSDRPQSPPGARAALRLMAEDEDIEVQEAACAALMALDR